MELYIKIPKGFELDTKGDTTDHVPKIHNNMYIQKQAGRVWYQHLNRKLIKDLGFTHSTVDKCVCSRTEDVKFHNTKGVWRLHIWPKISDMTELSLFRMESPEQWVRGVFIPAANKEISGDEIALQEFYVYLG